MVRIKNYVYGVASADRPDDIEQQLRAMNHYRNKLCAIELDRREAFMTGIRSKFPEFVDSENTINELLKSLEDARNEIKAIRKKSRRKSPAGIDTLKDRCKQIVAHLKEQRKIHRELKAKTMADPEVKKISKSADAAAKEATKKLSKESDLFWCNKTQITQNCKPFAKGPPPRFLRYQGKGASAVQLQGGRSVDEMSSDKNYYCRFDMDSYDGKRVDCYFRLGTVNRKAHYVKIRVRLHRPLPDGRFKWCYLHKDQMADITKWRLRLTVELPEEEVQVDQNKWVAVHFGWLKQEDGLRTVVVRGYDGYEDSMILPQRHLDDYDRLDAIYSDQSIQLNTFVEIFREWGKNRPLPDWMVDAHKHCGKWRSPARIRELMKKWEGTQVTGEQSIYTVSDRPEEFNRFSYSQQAKKHLDIVEQLKNRGYVVEEVSTHGKSKYYRCYNYAASARTYNVRVSNHVRVAAKQDGSAYYDLTCNSAVDLFLKLIDNDKIEVETINALQYIVNRERDLWRHATRLSSRITNRRRDWYRCFVKRLTEKYDVAMISRLSVNSLTKNVDPEKEAEIPTAVRRHARWAAISEFVGFLAEKYVCRMVEVDTRNITKHCAGCGKANKTTDRRFQCVNCNKTIDVDDNALSNIVNRGTAMLADDELAKLKTAYDEAQKKKADEQKKRSEAAAAAKKKLAAENKAKRDAEKEAKKKAKQSAPIV